MFNAKQSALYVAVLGALFAGGEANAACTPSVRLNGVLTCLNAQPNTLTCNIQVSVDPACVANPLLPGCDFGHANFTPGTSDLFSQCSYTGAATHPPPTITTIARTKLAQSSPSSRVVPSRTFKTTGSGNGSSGPVNNPGNGPQKVKCVNGFLTGTGRRVPCVDFTDPNNPPVLKNSGGSPVTEIIFPDSALSPMVCGSNGTCKTTEEIFPTDNGAPLTCPNPPGGHATDFTPTPPFIVGVDVFEDDSSAPVHFGCNGTSGNFYSCEGLSNFSETYGAGSTDIGSCFNGSGGFNPGGRGDTTGLIYCETGQLPLGVLVCGS
jgi:hypothetical protein